MCWFLFFLSSVYQFSWQQSFGQSLCSPVHMMQLCHSLLINNSSPQRSELALFQNIRCFGVNSAVVCYIWDGQAWALVPQKVRCDVWPVLLPWWRREGGRLHIVPGLPAAPLRGCGMRELVWIYVLWGKGCVLAWSVPSSQPTSVFFSYLSKTDIMVADRGDDTWNLKEKRTQRQNWDVMGLLKYIFKSFPLFFWWMHLDCHGAQFQIP